MKSTKTKPPPAKTHKSSDLFMNDENDEESSGDLFSSLTKSATITSVEATPTEATPTEDGASETVEESPKPQKKRLAGAVPMFGGAELLGKLEKRRTSSSGHDQVDLFGSLEREKEVK